MWRTYVRRRTAPKAAPLPCRPAHRRVSPFKGARPKTRPGASPPRGACRPWTPPEWECAMPTPPRVGVCDADASLFKGVCDLWTPPEWECAMPTPPKVGVCDADASLFKGVCDLWTPPEWECAKPTPPKVGVCDADASLFKGVCVKRGSPMCGARAAKRLPGGSVRTERPWSQCALLRSKHETDFMTHRPKRTFSRGASAARIVPVGATLVVALPCRGASRRARSLRPFPLWGKLKEGARR